MMNQMGHGPPGGMRFGGPQGPPNMGNGPRGMGPRGQGFQSIPPSGPMMRQQVAPVPNMMGNGPGDMQRMRLPPSHMMGPGGVPNGPQKVPVSHPSPGQHGAAGSPAGMWSNMGSPNPNGMSMQQQQSIGSPRTPGDQNHGSPMMQNNMRSQTPGMTSVPNNQQGMGQPRMVGPQGNMGPMNPNMNPRMSMMPPHGQMMHQMHPGGPQGPNGPPGGPPTSQQQGQGPPSNSGPGQSSPSAGQARASPMHQSHPSPMGVNHPSPHMQGHPHMPSPGHMGHPGMGPQMTNPANSTKNEDYNLDFLDSIPNEQAQAQAQNGPHSMENGGNNGPGGPHQQGQPHSGPGSGNPNSNSNAQQQGHEDDFMNLLDT